jgi:hypothetical protein
VSADTLQMLLLSLACLQRVTWTKWAFDEASDEGCRASMKTCLASLRHGAGTAAASEDPSGGGGSGGGGGGGGGRPALRLLARYSLLRLMTSVLVLWGPSKRNPITRALGQTAPDASADVASDPRAGVDYVRSTGTPRARPVSGAASAGVGGSDPHVAPPPIPSSTTAGSGAPSAAALANLGPSTYRPSRHEAASRQHLLGEDVIPVLVNELGSMGIRSDGSSCQGGVCGLFSGSHGLSRPGSWLAADALVEVGARRRFC